MAEHSHRNPHGFAEVSAADLCSLDRDVIDALPFAVVGLSREGLVEVYSANAVRLGGLPRDSVIGSQYFAAIAQCMNNFMVAQRFEDEPELDVIIDYVLTFRMRPTPVRLRLLQGSYGPRRFILIQP